MVVELIVLLKQDRETIDESTSSAYLLSKTTQLFVVILFIVVVIVVIVFRYYAIYKQELNNAWIPIGPFGLRYMSLLVELSFLCSKPMSSLKVVIRVKKLKRGETSSDLLKVNLSFLFWVCDFFENWVKRKNLWTLQKNDPL